jgi:hypothetical protein
VSLLQEGQRMKDYQNEVRIDVLMAQGTVDVAFLKNEGQAKALDQRITTGTPGAESI